VGKLADALFGLVALERDLRDVADAIDQFELVRGGLA
jgi:hypothetical protein